LYKKNRTDGDKMAGSQDRARKLIRMPDMYLWLYEDDSAYRALLKDPRAKIITGETFTLEPIPVDDNSEVVWNGSIMRDPMVLSAIHYWRNNIDFSYLDIGAHIGMTVLGQALYYKRCGRSIHIHAFEPGVVFALLKDNITLNGASDIVTCVNAAVSDKDDTLDFYVVPTSTAGSSLFDYSSSHFPDLPTVRNPVSAVRVDTYVKNIKPTPGLIIKIDTEGADFQVLDGSRKTLLSRECTMLVELTPIISQQYCSPVERLLEFGARYILIEIQEQRRIIDQKRESIEDLIVRTYLRRSTDVLMVPKTLIRGSDLVERVLRKA
jgi:FkbM family methyltransferase